MQRVMRDSIMGNSGRHQLEYSSRHKEDAELRWVLGQHQQEYSSQEENSSSLVGALVVALVALVALVVRRMESKVGVPCQAQQQHNDSQSGQSAGAPQAEGGSTKLSVLFSVFKKNNRNLTFQLNLETKMFVAASFAATMSLSHFYY